MSRGPNRPQPYLNHSPKLDQSFKQPPMLESGKRTLTEDLQGAVDQALRSGMDAEAIARMVAERVKVRRVSDANEIVGVLDAPEPPPEDAADVIYEDVGQETAPEPQPVRTDMVAERVKVRRVSDANEIVGVLDAPETPPEDAGDVIYEPGDLPEGLIDLPSAAARYSDKYGVSEDAMRKWVNRGHVAKAGRVRAPARGGGYIVVCESELVEFMAQPRNKGGRPRKRPK